MSYPPSSRLSAPAFVGPTDKAAMFQKHPIPGQLTLPLAAATPEKKS